MVRNYTAPLRPRYPRSGSSGGGLVNRAASYALRRGAAPYIMNAAAKVPYIGTAVRAAGLGYQAYRMFRGQRTATQTAMKKRKTFQGSFRYVGKFKKPKKGGKVSLPKKLGCVLSVEQYGAINDPDLVSIGHSTFPFKSVVRAICYAILRKILKKAINFDGNDLDQEIPAFDYNDAKQGVITFIWKDEVSGTISRGDLELSNNDTIRILAEKANSGDFTNTLFSQMYNKLDNEAVWHTRTLERVMFIKPIRSGISIIDQVVLVDMNMLNEVIKLSVSSNIKIQNRTLSVGGSADTDRVDAQPVKGTLLKFKGLPKLKNMHVGAGLFSQKYITSGTTSEASMILVRGAELPSGHLEPKVKQDWQNCYAQSNVSLQPGEIKSSKLTMKKGAYFNNFFKAVQTVTGVPSAGNRNISSIPGYSQVFFFEELLNSGSTNKITLNYEQQLYISCYLITGRSNSINTDHLNQEYNNTTA